MHVDAKERKKMAQYQCLFIIALATVGCSNNGASTECRPSSCPAGYVCVDRECRQVCIDDLTCATTDEICDDGICISGTRSGQPAIWSVDGDGSVDPLAAAGHTSHRIGRNLVINGENLDGVRVTLFDTTTTYNLEVCSTSESQLVVQMPDRLTSGAEYQLRVAAQAGSCTATLPVLQGEPGSYVIGAGLTDNAGTLSVAFGTAAGTAVEGSVFANLLAQNGQPSGYASLDADGKVPVTQLPNLGSSVDVFFSSGTWNKGPGIAKALVFIIAGGGGGAGSGIGLGYGGGGGAGGYVWGDVDVSAVSSVAVTVGTGGAGGAAGSNNGATGGASSFGAYISASGGVGGSFGTAVVEGAGGAGGTSSGGRVNSTGLPGGVGDSYNGVTGPGGSLSFGFFGGTGGAGVGAAPSGNNGVDAAGFGAGGSGAVKSGATTRAGGKGAPGIVMVWGTAN
jgi:hypothetical protein